MICIKCESENVKEEFVPKTDPQNPDEPTIVICDCQDCGEHFTISAA